MEQMYVYQVKQTESKIDSRKESGCFNKYIYDGAVGN
jgi:hypothetical protein